MTIVCYGDSNTWGYDPRYIFGDPYSKNWCEVLEELSGFSVRNLGENGRRIPGKEVLPTGTDLFAVMLGTNDLLQGDSSDTVCSKMEHFLKSIPLPPEKCLLISPPPMKLGAWVPDQTLILESLRMADSYQSLAEKLGVLFADAGLWNIPLTFDGVHFTEEGHRIFAHNLYRILLTNMR